MKRPPRRRKPSEEPWNDPLEPLELFVSPRIKARLGLRCRTTTEYLEGCGEKGARDMICPRCGRSFDGLACPACTALQSREAILQSQAAHLDQTRRGRLKFSAKRLARNLPWHLMLFGDHAHAYCGAELDRVGKANRCELSRAALAPPPNESLCGACLQALARLEESRAAEES